jgi:hypothetical protein
VARATDKDFGLTVKFLNSILVYEPESGICRWLVRRGRVAAGSIAGGMGSDGYHVLGINGRLYKTHRLVWFVMTGEWPSLEVEHRDLDQANNKWGNLRLATRAQNLANKRKVPNQTSIYKGVCWDKSRNKWKAYVAHSKELGRFQSEREAALAYDAAAAALYGEFALLNFPIETKIAQK